MPNNTVSITFTANASGAITATAGVASGLNAVNTAAQKSNASLNAQKATLTSLNKGFNTLQNQVKGLATAYLSLQGIRTLANFADEYVNLNARLKVVTNSTDEFVTAQRAVRMIADETYSSLEATANLYSRLTYSLKGLGSTQSEIAGITRTVNQALLVSGATAAEAKSAIIQLSQSFASGVLRGEEFNAVNEAGPRIMQALADSLRVSRGALREMATEGKLTSDVLRRALIEAAPEIAAEASKIPLTIGRAYQSLRNNLLIFVGEADKAYQISNRLAIAIKGIGQNINEFASFTKTAALSVAAFAGTRGLVALVTTATKAGSTLGVLRLASAGFLAVVGGIPGVIALAVTSLALLTRYFLSTNDSVDRVSESIRKFRELTANGIVSPDAGKVFKRAVDETLTQIQRLQTEVDAILQGGEGNDFDTNFLVGPKIAEITALKEELAKLQEEGTASLSTLGQNFLDAFKNADVATDISERLKISQTQLYTVLEGGGAALGLQQKAALELASGLQQLDEIEKRSPELIAEVTQGRLQLQAVYQKELAQIAKSTTVRTRSVTSVNAEASARDRLNGIVERYSVEEDDANKIRAKFAGLQRQVNADLRNYPGLAEESATATAALAAALETALDNIDPFRREINELLTTFENGNIDQHSQAMLRLAIAIEEATNAGDTAKVARLQRALEALEISAGKAATASDELRVATEEMTEDAEQQAKDWADYWDGALNTATDAFGDFVANGLTDFKSFGKSLQSIAKKIMSDLVSAFAKKLILNLGVNTQGGTGPGTGGGVFSGPSGIANGLFGNNTGGFGSFASNAGGAFAGVTTGLQGIRAGNIGQGAIGGATAGFSVGGPIGAVIGAIVGGLAAAINGKKKPDFRVGGENSNVRKPEGDFETVFGTVRAGSRLISYEELIKPIQDFDLAIQGIVQATGGGAEELDAIAAALDRWSVDLKGDAATAENVLGSRFDAILTTFSENVQGFVNESEVFEERVGRLKDALTIERIAGNDNGITDSFSELSTLLVRFRVGTEDLSETFTKLSIGIGFIDNTLQILDSSFAGTRLEAANFAGELIELAGGFDAFSQLATSAFDALFSKEEQAQLIATQAKSALTAALSDVGLDLSAGTDAIRAALRTQIQEAFASGDSETANRLLRAAAALNAYNIALDNLASTTEEAVVTIAEESATFNQLLATGVSPAANQAMNEYRAFINGLSSFDSTSGVSEFNLALTNISSWMDETIINARNLAIAAGLEGVATEDLAAIREEAALRAARASATLMDASTDIVRQLAYTSQASSRRGLIYGSFALPGAQTATPERFQLATQLGGNVRQLAEALGESFTTVLDTLQVPLGAFLRDLNVDIASLDTAVGFDNLVSAARLLGVELTDLTSQLGADIGTLNDPNSDVNDAFERAVDKLPTAVGGIIRTLLTQLESAKSPEAIASARASLLAFLDQQTPAVRAALAPFFDELDVSSFEEQQALALEQSNRYLNAANAWLERIANNTKPAPGTSIVLGEKGRKEDKTNQLLQDVVTAINSLAAELRGKNTRSKVGV